MPIVRHAGATDAELLSRTREDPQAFGAFYDRFEADVLAFFWRATRRGDLAADLTAETFAQALASAGGFDPALRPGADG
jgi:DNA-directed RNA polymerase specialized sigma24 family protein